MSKTPPSIVLLGPPLIFFGAITLLFSIGNLVEGNLQSSSLIFLLAQFTMLGGFGMFGGIQLSPYTPIIYLIQTEARRTSQLLISLLPWIGMALIAAGIACIILGSRAAQKAEVTVWGRHPVIKEIIKEREIVYIRCRYCGTKMPETEEKCPKCGATL